MFKNKEEFKFEFSRRIIETYGRTVEEAHITEKFMVLELMVRDYASVNWAASKAVVATNEQKQMHYFSMEFLMVRLLVNNMMNLGIYDIAKEGEKYNNYSGISEGMDGSVKFIYKTNGIKKAGEE